MGCQLQLQLRLRRHPRRSHLPKVTIARIIFDKAFRQMKFKWLHICWGMFLLPPRTPRTHISWSFLFALPRSPIPLDATGHFSMSARSSFSFPHYAASHYLCLFACLALCCLVVVVYWHLCLSPIIEEGNAYFK